jgi:hypothetical protein
VHVDSQADSRPSPLITNPGIIAAATTTNAPFTAGGPLACLSSRLVKGDEAIEAHLAALSLRELNRRLSEAHDATELFDYPPLLEDEDGQDMSYALIEDREGDFQASAEEEDNQNDGVVVIREEPVSVDLRMSGALTDSKSQCSLF